MNTSDMNAAQQLDERSLSAVQGGLRHPGEAFIEQERRWFREKLGLEPAPPSRDRLGLRKLV